MQSRELLMQNRSFTLVYPAVLVVVLGMGGHAIAQKNGTQQPSARQQLQHIHRPQSIDQELARLTKDLELTPQQQQQVRPLLEEHHDKIQALLDKHPEASRQQLAPQIHAISDETHTKIHALLTDRQRELEKAMQQREHKGEEHRRPAPPVTTPPDNEESLQSFDQVKI
jgi:protein CpxP